VRARVSPARPGDGPGPDPAAASGRPWSVQFPWVDQFDPGSGEVTGVAGRQRRFGSAADGGDLGVGHTDRPPERFPAAGRADFFGRQRVEPRNSLPSASAAGLTVADLIIEAMERFADREAFVLGDQRGPHPLGSLGDHAYLCEDAGIAVLLVHPKFAETGAALAERCPGIECLLTLGPAEVGQDLLALIASVPAGRLERGPAREEDTAWLQYTGGTTGTPKAVMVPHRAFVAQTYTLTCSWGLPETPRFLLTSPITDAGSPRRHDLSSLQTILYGAAPMAPARIAEALEEFGPVLTQGVRADRVPRDVHQPPEGRA
jgi:hypothetical protein